MAAFYGSPQIAQLLVARGADRTLQDNYGASFDDYLQSPGIGIFPADAERLFGIKPRPGLKDAPPPPAEGAAACPEDGGWQTGASDVDDEDLQCDIDQRTDLDPDVWYKEYYLRGRPVLLRGALPLAERCSMQKSNAEGKPMLASLKCGATAYPSITFQRFCPQMCTVEGLEGGSTCFDYPVPGGPERAYKPTAVLGHKGKLNTARSNGARSLRPGGPGRGQDPLAPQWAMMVPKRFHSGQPPFQQLCTAYVQR